MVRLKEYREMAKLGCTKISIPLGTIKREYQDINIWKRKISIPLGTIKSLQIHPLRCSTQCISIPLGTIKSNETGKGLKALIAFQYLLVRLKENG